MAVEAPGNVARSLRPDAEIELFDLDYSVQMGAPGNPSHRERFVNDLQTNGGRVEHGGNVYVPFPITLEGTKRSAEGTTARPVLRVGNGNGAISALIRTVPGKLLGALLLRRSIFARHLDHGADPAAHQTWGLDVWRLERRRSENKFWIEFELSAKPDVDGFELPGRRVEPDLCPFAYAVAADGCSWVPGAGPYFDANDQPTDAAGDACSFSVRGCKLRHQARALALPFGGYPAAAWVLR